MRQSRLIPMAAATLLAFCGMLRAETVNWSLTVAAEETYPVSEAQSTDLWASFDTQGSLGGVVPPPGTSRLDAHITLVEPGWPDVAVSFSGLPNTHPKYAVWFGSIGGSWHRVILFGGSVGGTVLGWHEFQCQDHGYHNMHVIFNWTIEYSAIRTISATDSGSLAGGVGESKQASWSAAPQATPGASVGAYRYDLTGSNPAVVLSHSVDGTGTAGLVTAKFPACLASEEVCDGQDNDCDGQVDEISQPISCGLGMCQNTVNSCSGGLTLTCDPMKGSTGEKCDGVDNDCDGVVDNGCTALDTAPARIESLASDPSVSPQVASKLASVTSALEQAKAAAGAGDWSGWAKLMDQAVKDLDTACMSLDASACGAVGTSLAKYTYEAASGLVSSKSSTAKPALINSANAFLSEANDYLHSGDYRTSVAKSINAAKKVT